MKINLDEGYSFGLGIFETILIYKNKPIFLEEHINRANESLKKLNITTTLLQQKEVENFLEKNKNNFKEKEVLKIIISENNRIFIKRSYNYTDKDYNKGFSLNVSKVLRNETSPLSFHKTLNYGDNILEKRKSLNLGYDEPLFLNSKSYISEGATSNIFFVKDEKLYTPKLSCGMLNGIIRQYILKNYSVIETNLKIEEIKNFDEAFITNSLLGVMPVSNIEEHKFLKKDTTLSIYEKYKKDVLG